MGRISGSYIIIIKSMTRTLSELVSLSLPKCASKSVYLRHGLTGQLGISGLSITFFFTFVRHAICIRMWANHTIGLIW